MRRLITTLAVVGLFGLSATPAMAAPADVFVSDPVTGNIDCGAHQYTFTGGAWRMVVHFGDTTPSGNSQFSVKGTADKVTVTDGANVYRVEGMWHFGGTHLANDTTPFHFGMHLRIVGQGGAVDDVSAVLTGSPFGDMWIDIGTCVPLG